MRAVRGIKDVTPREALVSPRNTLIGRLQINRSVDELNTLIESDDFWLLAGLVKPAGYVNYTDEVLIPSGKAAYGPYGDGSTSLEPMQTSGSNLDCQIHSFLMSTCPAFRKRIRMDGRFVNDECGAKQFATAFRQRVCPGIVGVMFDSIQPRITGTTKKRMQEELTGIAGPGDLENDNLRLLAAFYRINILLFAAAAGGANIRENGIAKVVPNIYQYGDGPFYIVSNPSGGHYESTRVLGTQEYTIPMELAILIQSEYEESNRVSDDDIGLAKYTTGDQVPIELTNSIGGLQSDTDYYVYDVKWYTGKGEKAIAKRIPVAYILTSNIELLNAYMEYVERARAASMNESSGVVLTQEEKATLGNTTWLESEEGLAPISVPVRLLHSPEDEQRIRPYIRQVLEAGEAEEAAAKAKAASPRRPMPAFNPRRGVLGLSPPVGELGQRGSFMSYNRAKYPANAQTGKWACPRCTYINPAEKSSCEMCGQGKKPSPSDPRPGPPVFNPRRGMLDLSPPVRELGKRGSFMSYNNAKYPANAQTGEWACPSCTYINPAEKSSCKMCGHGKKSSPSDPRAGPPAVYTFAPRTLHAPITADTITAMLEESKRLHELLSGKLGAAAAAPHSPPSNDMTLIVGATPGDTYWESESEILEDPNIYFLDKRDSENKTRFISADVCKLRQIIPVSKKYENTFKTIVVDVGTWHHFFEGTIPVMSAIFNMLQPGGILFVPQADFPLMNKTQQNTRIKKDLSQFRDLFVKAGFSFKYTNAQTLYNKNPVLDRVLDRLFGSNHKYPLFFYIGTKGNSTPPLGGAYTRKASFFRLKGGRKSYSYKAYKRNSATKTSKNKRKYTVKHR